MRRNLPLISLCIFVMLFSNVSQSDSSEKLSLKTLFQKSDVVAFVRVMAGDAHNFRGSTYRADVLDAYKGCRFQDVIFFGPSRGYEIDSQYLVFLSSEGDSVKDHMRSIDVTCSKTFDPEAPYFTFLLYDYYTEMPVIYTFGGKINGYAVRFPCNKIAIPTKLTAVQTNADDGQSKYCLLSREAVHEYLRSLSILN